MVPLTIGTVGPVFAATLPASTWVMLALIALVPVVAFLLYWVDRSRADGSVSILGSDAWRPGGGDRGPG